MKTLSSIFAGLLLAVSSLAMSTAWAAPVDINTADAKTLEALDGVGPSKAAAIVEYRAKNGPFKSVADLEKVPGIGAATIEKNRDNIALGGGKAAKSVAKKDGK